MFSPVTSFVWGERDGTLFTETLMKLMRKWPSGEKIFLCYAGKKNIKEVTRLLNAWTQNPPLRSISLKAIHTMPALLLQKPSKKSKSREYLVALERRLQLWERGEIKSLLLEVEIIQQRLTSNNDPKNIADVSIKFASRWEKETSMGH